MKIKVQTSQRTKKSGSDARKIISYQTMLFNDEHWARKVTPEESPSQEVKKQVDKNKLSLYPKLLANGFVHLCNNGSLHGLKYITDRKRMIGERIIWTAVCLMSITMCGMYIRSSWQKWVSVPFSLVIDKEYTPIYDIPFPTVVVCPENTVKRSLVDLETETDKVTLFAASLICENMPAENYSLAEDYGEETDEKILDFLRKSTPKCTDIIKSCRWKSTSDTVDNTVDCCEDFFSEHLISYGICYAFNYAKWSKTKKEISKNVWNPADGYDFDIVGNTSYPRRIFSIGEEFGLSVELYFNSSDTQPFCDGSSIGFKVLINPPYESVISKKFSNIPMERQTTFSITPHKVSTEKKMKSVHSNIRKCYFVDEKTLTYFDYYSQYNCVQECEIKYFIKKCDCIPFYHFKARRHTPSLRLCTSNENYECMRHIKGEINKRSISSYYAAKQRPDFTKRSSSQSTSKNDKEWCRCYPSCSELNYNMELFYSDFMKLKDTDKPQWAVNFTPKKSEITRFDVTFKESIILGYHREITYDTMDFLGSIGGMLSLFLGFSIMSVIEIIYYVLIQPLFVVLKIRK